MKKKERKSRYLEYEKKLNKAYVNLKSAYREIKDSYTDMIFRFALAAEFKDDSTGTHLVRIADYSTAIAEEMKFPKREITMLRYASLMHDVGKLILPDEILKKKGGLTPLERDVVKKHTTLGADIFSGSSSALLRSAREVILTHHERYDGTGYPRGLKKNDIPLPGRIVALADVFDALTSKRPYKDAYGFDESVEIISSESGRHFDPKVVRAFLKRKESIREIWSATKAIDTFIDEEHIEPHGHGPRRWIERV
ncbi:MAG: HD domain-containing phosphohydrolase [Candidatus Omnitrophota bacterium]